jgi:two-component system, NarL family, response regulator DegU
MIYLPPNEDQGRLLTIREWDCLLALADGCTNPQIADRIGLRYRTVKNHLYAAYRKLGVSNRTEAAMKTLRLIRGR